MQEEEGLKPVFLAWGRLTSFYPLFL